MENLTERSTEPPRKNATLRGVGLAWLIVIAGYGAVSFIGLGQDSPWGGYGLLVPPLVAVGSAIVSIVCGEKDIAGGIFIGLVSIFGLLIVLTIIVVIDFFDGSHSFVNGWK
ncbi:hypothetical protein [Burkholderia ubonensis]|uniref:hypothetical protein n=1 Tax=Burkholderia ubonensis TaxID=101571 RepID=UPI002AB10B08|nr:hypothetical protein [Burkholderia ubonensis]